MFSFYHKRQKKSIILSGRKVKISDAHRISTLKMQLLWNAPKLFLRHNLIDA